MTASKKRILFEMIDTCVMYNMFTDAEVEQIARICLDAADRTLKKAEEGET